MNDEIKEILEDIDNKECYYIGTNGCLYQDLTKEQLLLIKDYISNLQQENIKLISENEAIKNIKYTVDEVIYKLRVDKAIDFIKNKAKNNCWIDQYEANDLINILEGNDENEKIFIRNIL